MRRRIRVSAAIATPVIAVITWSLAYQIAINHMASKPCCEDGMSSAPIIVLFGVAGFALAAILGLTGDSTDSRRSRVLVHVLLATIITGVAAGFMFFDPPLELTAEKTRYDDYWPRTVETVTALVVGALASVLPWSFALCVAILDDFKRRLPSSRRGPDAGA